MKRPWTQSRAFQSDFKSNSYPNTTTSNLVFASNQGVRVRIPGNNSLWAKVVESRLDELASLPVGWDGYMGRPVSFTCAQFAASLIERLFDPELPPPSIIPGSDGTMQIEWHRNQFDLEIDILAPYSVVATRHNCADGTTQEIELDSDFTLLASWVSDLKQDRNFTNAVNS